MVIETGIVAIGVNLNSVLYLLFVGGFIKRQEDKSTDSGQLCNCTGRCSRLELGQEVVDVDLSLLRLPEVVVGEVRGQLVRRLQINLLDYAATVRCVRERRLSVTGLFVGRVIVVFVEAVAALLVIVVLRGIVFI